MAIQIQGNGGTVAEVDGTSFRALRITVRPLDYGALGHYAITLTTGAYVALAAGAIMMSARWGDATRLAVVYRCAVQVAATVAATAAGIIDRSLSVVRGFTVADSSGTAAVFTGNNQKMRTSMGASLFSDMRVMGNAGLTPGTGTADANPLGKAYTSMATGALTVSPTFQIIPSMDVIQDNSGLSHPVVLAQNEGLRWTNVVIGPATASLMSTFDTRWAEVAAF